MSDELASHLAEMKKMQLKFNSRRQFESIGARLESWMYSELQQRDEVLLATAKEDVAHCDDLVNRAWDVVTKVQTAVRRALAAPTDAPLPPDIRAELEASL